MLMLDDGFDEDVQGSGCPDCVFRNACRIHVHVSLLGVVKVTIIVYNITLSYSKLDNARDWHVHGPVVKSQNLLSKRDLQWKPSQFC
jgi:hypothetical protein